jgi:hypothetical protein
MEALYTDTVSKSICCKLQYPGYLPTTSIVRKKVLKKQRYFLKMTSCTLMNLFQYTSAAVRTVVYSIMHYTMCTYLVEGRKDVHRSTVLLPYKKELIIICVTITAAIPTVNSLYIFANNTNTLKWSLHLHLDCYFY